MDDKDELIRDMKEFVQDVDRLNKRMLICATIIISVISVSSWIATAFVAYTYFTADYYNPTVETNDSTNTTNTIGGE